MAMQTLKQQIDALASGQTTSVALVTESLARIAAHNGTLNALITIDADKALAAAAAADAARAAGDTRPLLGVPLIHKDIFCHEGWKTSCGSKMLDNFIAPYSSQVAENCDAAGMVVIARANMDEFAMGSANENSFYGPVKNPWNTQTVPGGSSGGSAAAVAAGFSAVATGTDTGGSIRQPAAFCGITGIKPTYGIVSRYGMVAFASSLDQGGPMAHTAEDCALMLNVMAGFDERDSTSLEHAKEDYTRELNTPLAGLKIGLPREYFAEGLNADIAAAINAAVEQYKALGATIVDISLPNTKLAIPSYYVIAPAEASSNLSRFDGVRYGHRTAKTGSLDEMYEQTRAEGFGAEVKRRILTGAYVLSHGYYDAYYLQAQKIRRLIANDFQAAFAQCDVIMGPVTPTTAWNIGEKNADPIAVYLEDIYTLGVNLAGLPGMSVPVGLASNGLPIGLQIIGNYFSEAKMLGIAHQYQQVTDWHTKAPQL
ncbi:Asp-tRNA(Asn)/Glu-tRNA(Gln) amidotransferase subunit GatA [Chitinibacter tainanensis]|uniref:Asp-tRNA(Asn)/Glu-tRNA(Gln) amidotransferase subunit GatA n=1 Tax=Chitinibacter tainanensis TaxID=230667 RepID=UPI0023554D97|nr:Asp-tRNA(Asn)/Glu-tRNA(Gln) amidotransferase subunit GatA [Chitinibacter tainanensis]